MGQLTNDIGLKNITEEVKHRAADTNTQPGHEEMCHHNSLLYAKKLHFLVAGTVQIVMGCDWP